VRQQSSVPAIELHNFVVQNHTLCVRKQFLIAKQSSVPAIKCASNQVRQQSSAPAIKIVNIFIIEET